MSKSLFDSTSGLSGRPEPWKCASAGWIDVCGNAADVEGRNWSSEITGGKADVRKGAEV